MSRENFSNIMYRFPREFWQLYYCKMDLTFREKEISRHQKMKEVFFVLELNRVVPLTFIRGPKQTMILIIFESQFQCRT